jgi:hypothetical protein
MPYFILRYNLDCHTPHAAAQFGTILDKQLVVYPPLAGPVLMSSNRRGSTASLKELSRLTKVERERFPENLSGQEWQRRGRWRKEMTSASPQRLRLHESPVKFLGKRVFDDLAFIADDFRRDERERM